MKMKKTEASKKRKIYLAGKYGKREQLLEVANKLSLLGHTVTARWTKGNEVGQDWVENAIMDYEDVLAADLVLNFTEPYGSQNLGGGRHVEFGIAVAKGIECWLVGEREVIFHHLPRVKSFSDINSVLKRLNQ
jgi:hypothetical protein